jgi:hypothetical protein
MANNARAAAGAGRARRDKLLLAMKLLKTKQTVTDLSARRRTPACPTSERGAGGWLWVLSASSIRGRRDRGRS